MGASGSLDIPLQMKRRNGQVREAFQRALRERHTKTVAIPQERAIVSRFPKYRLAIVYV
jgi:hypothetical protein